MNIGIIDIGSNTARLLVASIDHRGVVQLRRERHYLRLGDDVHALGQIGPRKLREAARVAERFARIARKSGVGQLETIVTAPGRQARNGDELRAVIAANTRAPVVQLTGNDEGRLAWHGAVARIADPPARIGVVDLGGGSCELAIGSPEAEPDWVRSIEAGALRITRAYLSGSGPLATKMVAARTEIRSLLREFDPPCSAASLVVGGTARALGRIVGSRFGAQELDAFAATLVDVPSTSIAANHGMSSERARTLLGGTLVLSELARRLESTLEVGAGGLREGAALMLASRTIEAVV
jgi:exopolyphosphatase/guanosine-5'-triphosphate,3'-diphosphate pyrophosphatase